MKNDHYPFPITKSGAGKLGYPPSNIKSRRNDNIMQTYGIVGVNNVTVTMFNDDVEGVGKKVEQTKQKRRLAEQGATDTRFFPVNEPFRNNQTPGENYV